MTKKRSIVGSTNIAYFSSPTRIAESFTTPNISLRELTHQETRRCTFNHFPRLLNLQVSHIRLTRSNGVKINTKASLRHFTEHLVCTISRPNQRTNITISPNLEPKLWYQFVVNIGPLKRIPAEFNLAYTSGLRGSEQQNHAIYIKQKI